MSPVQMINPPGLPSMGYSNVAVVTGSNKTIYIGGQDAVNEKGEIVGEGDFRAQVEQTFKNLHTALNAAGAQLHNVIKFTLFVVQGQDIRPGFEIFQREWGEHPNPPLISMAFVPALARPEFLLEIEAIAVVPE